MPPIRNTNFIAQANNKVSDNLDPRDPFTILGISFIIISIVASLASYGMGKLFETQGDAIRDQIKALESKLTSLPLPEMLDFYSKTNSINTALKNHVYITSVFSVLSNAVEKNVYFKKFDFSSRDAGGYDLNITGVSPDYESIVRQLDVINADKYKKVFKFAELKSITTDQYGNITFDIKITTNPTIREDYINTDGPVINNKINLQKLNSVPLAQPVDSSLNPAVNATSSPTTTMNTTNTTNNRPANNNPVSTTTPINYNNNSIAPTSSNSVKNGDVIIRPAIDPFKIN